MNSKIKQIIKKISAVVFGLVFISQAFVADIALAGVTPVFYSTLGLKNRTQSTATWQTSVPASAGERIAFDVYYKNTISGTIAQNTKIRLDFEDNTGGQLRFKAYAYADNASYVYSLGDVVISNSNGYNFTFDSTAKTYPNHQTTADNVNVTFVQSNSVLVNVGQVSGGDQYDGHVVFEGVISGSTQTQQAQFNNASNDFKTLRVKNRTRGDTSWQSSVTANPGDKIAFDIYYHNTGEGSTAHNTKAKLTFPTSVQSQITVNGSVSADNAISALDTAIVTLNSNTSNLTFDDTGSWYPHQTTAAQSVTISKSYGTVEFNIGDVAGTCQDQGHMVFEATLSSADNPNLTITKSVRNITDGQSYYSSSVSADPGERLGFKIVVASNGQTAANNVYVSDTLPSNLIYRDNLSVSSGYSSGDITSGINLGTINSGNSVTITFEADVQSASYFSNGTVTLTNTAYASATNVSQRQASASVNVANTAANPNLTITKSVRNITDGQSYYSNSVNATPGERVGYKIIVASSGQTAANNVYVNDVLPSGLIYGNNLSVSSGYSSGDITSGINLGTINSGNSVTITFEADVQSASYFSNGTVTLANYAYASASGVSQVQDGAIVYVANTVVINNPNLTITKSVRNITDGQSYYSGSVNATPGERLGFKIVVASNGQTAVNNVYVSDTLPSNLIYRDNLSVSSGYSSGDITSGINLGTINSGNSVTITFEADVQSASYFSNGTVTLTNTAYASATNVSQRQASASVNVANTVNPVQTSTFTINKMVRNISKGETNWQNFVEASPGDQVEFYLSVTNTGSTAANGLYVKDTLPVKMTYLGNVKMDGYYNSGNVASASGIYIGDLSASQSRVVIFQAQVLGETEFNFGSTNVVNTATVYNASNSAIDSAIVAVNKRAVAGAETEVNTGLKEDLMSYLLLPALLAIVLMFVLRNQLFKVDKWLAVRGADNRVYQSQKTLDQKINQIREKENRK